MAKEYIEREALLKDISESVVFSVKEGQPSLEIRGANKIIDRIKSVPAADVVEVVHGEWKYNTDDFTPKMRCSVCSYNKPIVAGENIKQEPNNYCPNCGAKMDAERKCEDD